jgi:CBS domain-containing protein
MPLLSPAIAIPRKSEQHSTAEALRIASWASVGESCEGNYAMQVRHILREKGREVVTISGDATLTEAARLLARRHIGAVVVRSGGDGSVAGILSERDVVRAIAEQSVAALEQNVARHMTRSITTCSETDTVDDLMETMTNGRFRHVPVVENERLCGIVSIGDVVKSRIEETAREAASLRDYIAAG